MVVGSGYGGSIAASRCAKAGQTVCVLERGKEWLPGEFPESYFAALKEIQVHPGGKDTIGNAVDIIDLHASHCRHKDTTLTYIFFSVYV